MTEISPSARTVLFDSGKRSQKDVETALLDQKGELKKPENKKRPLDEFIDNLNSDFLYHDPPLIFERYIGKGSFGRVFKGISHYDALGEIAVKIMKDELLNNSNPMDLKDITKRFMNECVYQSFLSEQLEDKIVKVYDYGEFSDHWFMVMELMSDKSLRHVIKEHREYSLKDRISIMIDIAGTLEDIHQRNFVHRDVKPENALFSKKTYIVDGDDKKEFKGDRIIKLSDFGLARWIHSHYLPEQTKIIGSSDYMSPEQVHDPKHVDKRTDIFSFGVVIYEMLNGEYPREVKRDTEDEFKYLSKLVSTPAREIIDMNETVKDVNYIIKKCMEQDPNKRYQSMEEVLFDLKDYYHKKLAA